MKSFFFLTETMTRFFCVWWDYDWRLLLKSVKKKWNFVKNFVKSREISWNHVWKFVKILPDSFHKWVGIKAELQSCNDQHGALVKISSHHLKKCEKKFREIAKNCQKFVKSLTNDISKDKIIIFGIKPPQICNSGKKCDQSLYDKLGQFWLVV